MSKNFEAWLGEEGPVKQLIRGFMLLVGASLYSCGPDPPIGEQQEPGANPIIAGQEEPNLASSVPRTYVMNNLAQVDVTHPEGLDIQLVRKRANGLFAPYTELTIRGAEHTSFITDKGCRKGSIKIDGELFMTPRVQVLATGAAVPTDGGSFSLDYLKDQ